jgi:hypothetical protein
MGGMGSGNWYRWDSKDTVESCRSIDVRQWHRDGLLKPGILFSWAWWHDETKAATITVRTEHNEVVLSYRYRVQGGDWQDVEETIPLTWTVCNYGGQRPWFQCPEVRCGRRVAILYGAGRYFLCRYCYDLAYESTREPTHGRLRSKAQKIRRRLGDSASLDDPLPPKPKYMHWKTYWRLCREAKGAELQAWVALSDWLARVDAAIERRSFDQSGSFGLSSAESTVGLGSSNHDCVPVSHSSAPVTTTPPALSNRTGDN